MPFRSSHQAADGLDEDSPEGDPHAKEKCRAESKMETMSHPPVKVRALGMADEMPEHAIRPPERKQRKRNRDSHPHFVIKANSVSTGS